MQISYLDLRPSLNCSISFKGRTEHLAVYEMYKSWLARGYRFWYGICCSISIMSMKDHMLEAENAAAL